MTPPAAQCSCANDFACADAKTGEACNDAQGLLSVKQRRQDEWAFRRVKGACIALREMVDDFNTFSSPTCDKLHQPNRCDHKEPNSGPESLKDYWSGDHRPKVTARGAREHNGG